MYKAIVAIEVESFIILWDYASFDNEKGHPCSSEWNCIGDSKLVVFRALNPFVVVEWFLTEPANFLHQNSRVFVLDHY